MHTRLHDWLGFAFAIAAALGAAALVAGSKQWAAVWTAAALGAAAAARASSQRTPAPMPYSLRWVLHLPRGSLSVAALREILAPRPGEHVLEVGPGIGIYSIPIAAALAPGGTLEALDVQREMLEALMRRVRTSGATNITATEGDAQRLPYDDHTFDGAYLVGVLGEVPDPSAALRELRRVLKPGGRLVIGEVLVLDPDGVRLPTLQEAACRAGFIFERRSGWRFSYFARFRLGP